mgnify:FL=1
MKIRVRLKYHSTSFSEKIEKKIILRKIMGIIQLLKSLTTLLYKLYILKVKYDFFCAK